MSICFNWYQFPVRGKEQKKIDMSETAFKSFCKNIKCVNFLWFTWSCINECLQQWSLTSVSSIYTLNGNNSTKGFNSIWIRVTIQFFLRDSRLVIFFQQGLNTLLRWITDRWQVIPKNSIKNRNRISRQDRKEGRKRRSESGDKKRREHVCYREREEEEEEVGIFGIWSKSTSRTGWAKQSSWEMSSKWRQSWKESTTRK